MKGALIKNVFHLIAAYLVFGMFGVIGLVHAQSPLGIQDFSLTLRPSYPEPHSSIIVGLNDYSVNAVGAEVHWFVNGSEDTTATNSRELTLMTGALGEKQNVRAVLRRTDGTSIETSIDVVPTTVDLVLEADTYVPSFYEGRALPGRNSNLHAVAIVHDGGELPDSGYTYRWTVGQDVLFSGPVLGKTSVTFPMPLYRKELIVEVINPTGHIVARKSMMLEPTTPELYFYEWSPLKGLYRKEISNPFSLIGEETVVYGEPYFIQHALDNTNADVTWRIDGAPAAPDSMAPNAIPLNRGETGGKSAVDLRVVTRDRVPQVLEKRFNIIAQ